MKSFEELLVNDNIIMRNGVIVRVCNKFKRDNKFYVELEDSAFNSAAFPYADVNRNKIDWPYEHSYLEVAKCVIGERVLSIADGYYFVLNQVNYNVLIKWEDTERTDSYNIRDIIENTVRDKIQGGHYIYGAFYNDKIVYIGKGVDNRYRHCVSGKSHVYELNRHHFNNEKVRVEIIKSSLTNDEAKELELKLIKDLNPEYNVVGNTGIVDA